MSDTVVHVYRNTDYYAFSLSQSQANKVEFCTGYVDSLDILILFTYPSISLAQAFPGPTRPSQCQTGL